MGRAPVLLVTRDSIPEATRAELERLEPRNIVILGGPAVVSEDVEEQLGQFARESVFRFFGEDRFVTAAEISKELTLHERVNVISREQYRPFSISLEFGQRFAIISLAGDLQADAQCERGPDGDTLRVIMTADRDGWWTFSEAATASSTPRAPGEEVVVLEETVPSGTHRLERELRGATAVTPDGRYLAIPGDATAFGFNILRDDSEGCVLTGVAFAGTFAP